MADKTTNLQLQKIDNTDYAGNFPTIYNNNLEKIDQKLVDSDKEWNVITDLSQLNDILEFVYSSQMKEIVIKKKFRVKCSTNYQRTCRYFVSIFDKTTYKCDLGGIIRIRSNTIGPAYCELRITENQSSGNYNGALEITNDNMHSYIDIGNNGIRFNDNSVNISEIVTDYPHFVGWPPTKNYIMIEYQND